MEEFSSKSSNKLDTETKTFDSKELDYLAFDPKELDSLIFFISHTTLISSQKTISDKETNKQSIRKALEKFKKITLLLEKYDDFLDLVLGEHSSFLKNLPDESFEYRKEMVIFFKKILCKKLIVLSPHYSSIVDFIKKPITLYDRKRMSLYDMTEEALGLDIQYRQTALEFIELCTRSSMKRLESSIRDGSLNQTSNLVEYWRAITILICAPYRSKDTQRIVAESILKSGSEIIKRDKFLIIKFVENLKAGTIDKASANYDWFKAMTENHGSKCTRNFMKKYDAEGKSELADVDCKEVVARPSNNMEEIKQECTLDPIARACS